MRVERLLQVQVAALTVLATVMLGFGEHRFLLPAVVSLSAITALVVTDLAGWFRLPRLLANLAMIGAAALALNEFFRSDSQQQLVAIARLLIYVQLILLFQTKNHRIYGQLAVFSLLEVVVAALLNEGLEFGVLLLVYMLVAIGALAMFSLHRQLERFAVVGVRSRTDVAGPSPVESALAVIRYEPDQQSGDYLAGRTLACQIFGLGLASLVFAAGFFYCLPRTSGGAWKQGGIARRDQAGFAPEIDLDEIGRIADNDTPVMRVTFQDPQTGKPYIVIGQPYFRGAVLANYVEVDGHARWEQDVLPIPGVGEMLLQPPPAARELVRQDVFLEPTGEPIVFSVFPAYATLETPHDLRYQHETQQFIRESSGNYSPRLYRFVTLTTGFRFGSQIRVTADVRHAESEEDRDRLQRELMFLLLLPNRGRRLQRLIAEAQAVVKERAPDGGTVQIAEALEGYFKDASRFRYSVDPGSLGVVQDRDSDPIDDFVGRHHTGHCELFASALALMLRSQKIPARVVVGYRGGEFNYVGNYFLVRQRNAHAWVEAYLRPDEIPENSLPPAEDGSHGAWLRLDPTPAAGSESTALPLLDRITKSFDYAQWLWSDYVLRLSPEQQFPGLYQPLSGGGEFAWLTALGKGSISDLFEKADGSSSQRAGRSWWPPVRRLLEFLTLVVIVVAAYRWRRVWRRLLPHWGRKNASRQRPLRVPTIAFYRRLEHLLARAGLSRLPAQTPREYAGVAQSRLADRPATKVLAGVPQDVVEVFYHMRFGGHSAPPEQLQAIDRSLEQLERALKGRNGLRGV